MAVEVKKDPKVIIALSVLAAGILILIGMKVITWAEGIVGLGLVLVPSVFGQQKPKGDDEGEKS